MCGYLLIYAIPEDHYPPRGIPRSDRLVLVSKGTVGEIVGVYTHEIAGITITIVEFGDLIADLGFTVWERVEDDFQAM